MKSRYVILSNRIWNSDLAFRLKLYDSESSWFHISKKEDFTVDNLQKIQPDKIFIPHWSHIISQAIFSNFECIVFHMTDLPYGRGGGPLQNLIINKLESTKISAIKVSKEIDAGPIYLKQNLSLFGTAEEIFVRANNTIFHMIVKILERVREPTEQQGEVTVFKRRTPEMSSVENLDELETMFNYIRMLDAESYPHAFIETKNFKFEFTRASLKANKSIIADVRITKK